MKCEVYYKSALQVDLKIIPSNDNFKSWVSFI